MAPTAGRGTAQVTRSLAIAGGLAAGAVTVHTAVNLSLARRPGNAPVAVHERVSVLMPMRNEAHRVAPTLRALLASEGVPDLEVLLLDDGSTDGTAGVVRAVVDGDARVRLLTGGADEPPAGWLGKAWACHRLAREATGSVLVFIDADVTLTPHAIASTVAQMREARLDLFSPYPRQIAVTPVERLTQPLVTWLWASTMPLHPTEHTRFTSLAAACGQFLAVDALAYHASGGHEPGRGSVLEDVELLRTFKRHGYRGVPGLGGEVASCRMYDGAAEVVEGYTKSLWSAFGSPAGAAAVVTAMLLVFAVPPALAVAGPDRRTRAWGIAGYAAAVAGRAMVARRNAERVWPDSLAHPLSVAALAGLTLTSLYRKRAGTLAWRGRPVP